MKTASNKNIRSLVIAAMLMALGLVLPFLTGQIPQIGSMLLPMHIPVLICGLICGWYYGGIIGFILPLLRYVIFGMPPIFPTGIAMAFELAAYGVISGFVYSKFKKQNVAAVYISLAIAMLGGRVIWAIVRIILTGVGGAALTWQAFMASAFLNAIPGIILQLVAIPLLMLALDRTGYIKFKK